MSFSFLSPEQMSNIGGWMVFLAAIFLLILIPLTIVEIVAQKRLEKRCTAIANGTYAGTKVMKSERRSHNNKGEPAPLVFEQVRYYANGKELVTSPGLTHGITSKTELGAPLVIHYDPNVPTYCWAHTPSAKIGASVWRKTFAWCTVVAFVLGIALIRLS